MGHDHHHDHDHDHPDHGHHHHHHHEVTGRKLGLALLASVGILVVLGVGGLMANSLALLADAGHVVTDIAALALSWYATRQATRPADHRRTFGYHRTGILAALANAVSLILVAIWIGFEAWERMQAPPTVEPMIMMAVAAVGLVVNGIIGLKLHGHGHDLNVRSAYLHVVGDAAASAGVIVGAAIIWATGWAIVDPLLSVAIAAFIAWGAWNVVEESVAILMESAPPSLDVPGLVAGLEGIAGVAAVHDLHVWSIAPGMTSLSCHVLIADDQIPHSIAIVTACNRYLQDTHGIGHTTIQAEAEPCGPDSAACNLALVQPISHHH